ncbi:MAG TPA: CHAT domain-containing protein [Ktedonobacterales bacterium]|nr:CHAT domain-containing protein [Ktedonobacterales bacterium]
MQHLEYHLTVLSNRDVQAELSDGKKTTPAKPGSLNLAQLEVITKDYLPFLETGSQLTRDRLERLGTLLYELLFPPSIKGHFEELAWRKIEEEPEQYHLALSLTLHDGLQADVAALPWEFLYCPRGSVFLAADQRVSFSRRYADWVSLSPRLLTKGEHLRTLLVHLQPEDMASIALTRIVNVLTDLADQQTSIGHPMVLRNPDPSVVEDALQRYHPHIVHILAHGRFEQQGTLFALADQSERTVHWQRDRSFADLFRVYHPHLVFLQACEGGRSSDVRSFTYGAAYLVRKHIPAVIAMQYPITNEVGWIFAESLYRALADDHGLDEAVQKGRQTLAMRRTAPQVQDNYTSRDFAAPILWMRPGIRKFYDQEASTMDSTVNLTITTPSGKAYKADVPADTLIDLLIRRFLSQWKPPAAEAQKSSHYSLRPQGVGPLNRAVTLREAGLTANPHLFLVIEPLNPGDPISLTIEDEEGREYSAAVLLNTGVGDVAHQFFNQVSPQNVPRQEEMIVERNGEPSAQPQRLDLDRTLYEQGVSDGATLRIRRG